MKTPVDEWNEAQPTRTWQRVVVGLLFLTYAFLLGFWVCYRWF